MTSYGPRSSHSQYGGGGGGGRGGGGDGPRSFVPRGPPSTGYDVTNATPYRLPTAATASAHPSVLQQPSSLQQLHPVPQQPQQYGLQQLHPVPQQPLQYGLLGGKAGSFQSTSSGINSFGTFNEEPGTLGKFSQRYLEEREFWRRYRIFGCVSPLENMKPDFMREGFK